MSGDGSGIVITDVAQVPLARRLCPTCGAKPNRRTTSASFGSRQYPICRDCGHEFTDEATEH